MKKLILMFALLCSTTFVFAANTDDVTTILTKVRDRYDGKDYISDVICFRKIMIIKK